MQTPVLQQLTGLLAFCKSSLRAYPQFVGTDTGQYAWTADQVCKTTYPHQLFVPQADGIAVYPHFGKVNAPALAIYYKESDPDDVRGSTGGLTWPCAQSVTLGVQFVFTPRASDVYEMAHSSHFAQTIWEVLCNIIVADIQLAASTLRDTYNIEELGIGSMKFLPPFTKAFRAFEATMTMDYKRPPWDTGDDSSLVTDLVSIYTDHNEKGPTGADPMVQSAYTVPEE